jgi:hypothetical protein
VNQYVLTASGTVGTIVASPDTPNRWEMRNEATPYKKVNTGTCPTAVSSTTPPYQYTEIKNPSNEAIKVQVWQEIQGTPSDSIMAAYAGALIPPDDPARGACLGKANDGCPSPSEVPVYASYPMNGVASSTVQGCGGGSIAGLHNVPIAPNSSIMIYNAMYFATATNIKFQLKVRTICVGASCP